MMENFVEIFSITSTLEIYDDGRVGAELILGFIVHQQLDLSSYDGNCNTIGLKIIEWKSPTNKSLITVPLFFKNPNVTPR